MQNTSTAAFSRLSFTADDTNAQDTKQARAMSRGVMDADCWVIVDAAPAVKAVSHRHMFDLIHSARIEWAVYNNWVILRDRQLQPKVLPAYQPIA
jgi:hypothetical protein